MMATGSQWLIKDNKGLLTVTVVNIMGYFCSFGVFLIFSTNHSLMVWNPFEYAFVKVCSWTLIVSSSFVTV